MPFFRRNSSSQQIVSLEDAELIDSDSTWIAFIYASFILFGGALLTSTSQPAWILMMAMSLLLMGACLRAAAIDASAAASQLMRRDEEAEPLGVSGSSTPHRSLMALLRSARVVLLPQGQEASLADLENGTLSGADTLLLSQLTQQLSRVRAGQAGGNVGPPWMANIVPITEEDLDALPTCSYIPNSAPVSFSANSSAATYRHNNTASTAGISGANNNGNKVPSVAGQKLVSLGGSTNNTITSSCMRAGSSCSSMNISSICSSSKMGARKNSDSAMSSSSSNGLSCSICLEDVMAGEKLMTLPCMHQYHADCVRPWLVRKGKQAACPMCKTPVFER